MPKPIVFVGGGTLGPVTPLLAVAEEIAGRGSAPVFQWIGTADGPERTLVEAAGIPFTAISAGKFRRYASFRNITDVYHVIAGFFQAFALLGRIRPGVVVAAGGYVAVPVAWAARLRCIPVHVHQQDIRPGLANKLMAPFAQSISVAFEPSRADFGAKAAWTGNPVRPKLAKGEKEWVIEAFQIDRSVPNVLVLGGGTGAAGLNALVEAAAPSISARANVLHGTGKGKGSEASSGRYHQIEFLGENIGDAFAAADLVVSRGGMGTLTELAALGKPTIVVPMPRSHQEENAAFFASYGAAVIVDERTETPEAFAASVLRLLGDDAERERMAAAMRSLAKPDAAARVADIVIRDMR